MSALKYFQIIFTLMLSLSVNSATDLGQQPLFYPSAPETPRIQFLKTINGESFVNTNTSPYGNRFPGYGSGNGERETNPIGQPHGIAASKGQILICDAALKQVMVFDLAQNKVGVIKGLKRPAGIAVDRDGTRYVTDTGFNKILVYDSNNQYLKAYGDTRLIKPLAVSISGDELLYSDMKANQIVRLNKNTGEELGRVSKPGEATGKIYAPTALALDSQRNIYITDTLNGRVSKFASDGKFLDTIGQMGTNLGNFARPKGIAIDHDGRIYVVDGIFENIQIFNNQKQLLLFFGDVGNVRGGVNMPAQIMIDYDNVEYFQKYVAKDHEIEYLIYVTNTTGENKVNVYGFLKK